MKNNYMPDIKFQEFTGVWKKKSLFEIMDFSNGINAPKESYGIGRKMISVMDILDDEPIIYEKIRSSVQVNDKIEQKNKVEKGDLVFVRSSETLDEVGWAKAYQEEEYALFSGFSIRGKKKSDFNAKFIELSLNNSNRKQIERKAGGSTRYNVTQSMLKNIEVLQPCIKEQEKIANIFNQFENAIAIKQQKIEGLKKTKQGFMQKMFPQKDEISPDLRFSLSENNWKKELLGNLMEIGSAKRVHEKDWKKEGVRFLRARDLVSLSQNKKTESNLYISKDLYEEYSKVSGSPEKGHLLVSGVGTIGVSMLIKDEKPIYFKDGNIIWFKNNILDGHFFHYYFIRKETQNFINSIAGIGTVATYTITSGKITPIYYPEKEEQIKIGNFFKKMDKIIVLEEKELEGLNEIKKGFLQKLFI